MSDKYCIHGKEDLTSKAASDCYDMYDAKGEKNLSQPGKSDKKHSNPDVNEKQDPPSLKQSGKME